ncbi:MAG: phosphoglycerate mutase family protein [Rhodospirillales bacterium]|nr:phosphoglycerate mutase family protein [Rhodospirillales bacterium]
MRIFLARHGYSEGNDNLDNYKLRSDARISLMDKGWQQAFSAGEFIRNYCEEHDIPPPRLWMSPFQRTRETTSGIIYGANGFFQERPRVEESLTEMDFGDFSAYHSDQERREKMPWVAEAFDRARREDRFYARPPRGESPYLVQRRVEPFIDTIFRDKAEGVDTHLGVTHGVTLRVLAMSFMHIDPLRYKKFPNPENGSVYLIAGDRNEGYSLKQIYNGERAIAVDIDWSRKLKAGEAILPEVPEHLRFRP